MNSYDHVNMPELLYSKWTINTACNVQPYTEIKNFSLSYQNFNYVI